MSDVQVLYSFCVSRNCFREAAAAQLSLARRLRDEAPQQLEQIIAALSKQFVATRMPLPCFEALLACRCLCCMHHIHSLLYAGASANALSLVEPAHAWLEDPAGPESAPAQPSFLGSSLPEDPYLPVAHTDTSPRSPLPEAGQQVFSISLPACRCPSHANRSKCCFSADKSKSSNVK